MNEIGWTCSANSGEERRMQVMGKPEGRDHLGEPGVDGRIILTL